MPQTIRSGGRWLTCKDAGRADRCCGRIAFPSSSARAMDAKVRPVVNPVGAGLNEDQIVIMGRKIGASVRMPNTLPNRH